MLLECCADTVDSEKHRAAVNELKDTSCTDGQPMTVERVSAIQEGCSMANDGVVGERWTVTDRSSLQASRPAAAGYPHWRS